jgi:protein N-terminal amidase
MRIAVLQYVPLLGQVERNKETCRRLLQPLLHKKAHLDLLVLPELALSGYSHPSLEAINPFLETQSKGPTRHFATELAQSFSAHVVIGYPERHEGRCFNSAMIVNEQQGLVGHYRKKHLYTTDESWATEGPEFGVHSVMLQNERVQAVVGICMDLNPHRFTAPWSDYEFGNHVVHSGASIVLVPMAWLAPQSDADELATIKYWVSRLNPAWNNRQKLIFVAANFTGQEGTAQYAGSSCVLAKKDGRILMLSKLGHEEGLIDVILEDFGIDL